MENNLVVSKSKKIVSYIIIIISAIMTLYLVANIIFESFLYYLIDTGIYTFFNNKLISSLVSAFLIVGIISAFIYWDKPRPVKKFVTLIILMYISEIYNIFKSLYISFLTNKYSFSEMNIDTVFDKIDNTNLLLSSIYYIISLLCSILIIVTLIYFIKNCKNSLRKIFVSFLFLYAIGTFFSSFSVYQYLIYYFNPSYLIEENMMYNFLTSFPYRITNVYLFINIILKILIYIFTIMFTEIQLGNDASVKTFIVKTFKKVYNHLKESRM